ncbi:MAG: nitroreductase family protein [Christensenellaceae bacterium]
MELFDAIQSRRSIRKYEDTSIPREHLLKILEAGRLAPSWKNSQCWEFIVVSDPDIIKALGAALGDNPNRTTYEKVPYVIVACADPKKVDSPSDQQYYMTDMGIALEHMMLAATDLGLGTCWIGYFDEAPVKKVLHVPDNIRVVAATPLGVPAQQPDARPRRGLKEMVAVNTWGNHQEI